jgi:hypothetical protein
MPDQLNLFTKGTGMVQNPPQADTSAIAAVRIAPETGKLRMAVLRAIAYSGGMTDEEGIARTGLPSSTYRPRRVELHKGWRDFDGGYILDTGRRRKTHSGRPAIVWQITEKGREALRRGL